MNNLKTKIEQILKEAGVKHEFIPLPKDIAMDVDVHMKFHKGSLKDAMPNMVFRTEKGLVVVHRRGDTAIDNKKLKKVLGVERLSLAGVEDLANLGLQPGLVPPLGYEKPFYMDKKVLEQEEIYTGSGDRLFALKMNPHDLIKINMATVVDVTVDGEGSKESIGSRGGRVYSGIRATGRLHLGNYMGAVKGMLAVQNQYDCIFSVVDMHTITVPYDPTTLQQSVREIVLDYLAAGLDPEKCKLEIQSRVPQHTELAYLLSTIYPVSRLEDLPTYKDKKAQYPKYVNMGLLFYPMLMAADIMLYKAELVPVGIDQEPHLEVQREVARKFNSMFGDPSAGSGQVTFPEAYRFKTQGEKVPSLSGSGKMSKSIEGSFINLTDSLDEIKSRLSKVPTNSGTTGGDIPKEGGVASLFGLLALFNSDDMHKKYKQDYEKGQIRYSELKSYLADAIFKELQPFQEKRKEFEENPKLVDEILEKSNAECRRLADETMKEVRQKMGLI